MKMVDAKSIQKDFPLLGQEMNGKKIAYLDNGATTQKPNEVIRAIHSYYGGCNANPHRGAYALSVEATEIYESARARTAKFIKARRPEEIIFTKNATEALNLIAHSYGFHNIKKGDEIVITIAEHHSNLVPWQAVAKHVGATLKYIYLEKDGNLSAEDIEAAANPPATPAKAALIPKAPSKMERIAPGIAPMCSTRMATAMRA